MLSHNSESQGRSNRLSLRDRVGQVRLAEVPQRLGRKFVESVEVLVYRLDPAMVRQLPPAAIPIKKDSREDISCFAPTEPGQLSSKFIATALKRLDAGEHCYTRVEDGILASYGWTIEQQDRSYVTEVRQWLELPPHSAAVYDFYTHPRYRARGFYPACLLQALHDLADLPGVQNIHTAVLATNKIPQFWFERFGARCSQKLFYRRVLCFKQGWSVTT